MNYTDPVTNKVEKLPRAFLLSPSLSPVSQTNPSFRLVYYDKKDFNLIDYDQYFADLGVLSSNSSVNFVHEYAFDSAYKMASVSSFNVDDLLTKMRTDPLLFSQWMSRRTVLYNPQRYAYFCALSRIDGNEFDKCILRGD